MFYEHPEQCPICKVEIRYFIMFQVDEVKFDDLNRISDGSKNNNNNNNNQMCDENN